MDETWYRVVVWLAVSSVLALLGVWKPNVGRAAIGFLFLLMAVAVNIVTTLTNPQLYAGWADTALLPLYREIIVRLVAPNPALLVLPVAVYEIAVGLALLQRGRSVKLGLVGALLFLVGIMPFGLEEVANIVLVGGVAWLLRHDYPHSILDLVRARLRHRSPAPPVMVAS